MYRRQTAAVVAILVASGMTYAETPQPDSEISWAMGYEQPEHKCARPKMKKSNEVAGKVARYERKMARFAKCVQAHQSVLIADHTRIVGAAQKPITQEQAATFAEKLKGIETTVTELGEDAKFGLDPAEVDRLMRVGNRPSI